MFGKTRFGLAISGGGCKAFFGLGVGAVLQDAGLNVTAYSGTSAGAAMAASLVVGIQREVVEYFRSITLRNPSNFHARNLLLGTRPFPHERMYRRAIATYMDFDAIKRARSRLAINALEVPSSLYGTSLSRARLLIRLMSAYRKETKLFSQGRYRSVLAEEAAAAGLREVVFRNEHIESASHLEDIILASSSVPPMVRFQQVKGRLFLDGGVTRNLPLDLLEDVDIAVGVYYNLWTRLQYEGGGDTGEEIQAQPKSRGRRVVFVTPERDLPITTWDYANPRGVTLAYEAGLKAGEHLLPVLKKMRGIFPFR